MGAAYGRGVLSGPQPTVAAHAGCSRGLQTDYSKMGLVGCSRGLHADCSSQAPSVRSTSPRGYCSMEDSGEDPGGVGTEVDQGAAEGKTQELIGGLVRKPRA